MSFSSFCSYSTGSWTAPQRMSLNSFRLNAAIKSHLNHLNVNRNPSTASTYRVPSHLSTLQPPGPAIPAVALKDVSARGRYLCPTILTCYPNLTFPASTLASSLKLMARPSPPLSSSASKPPFSQLSPTHLTPPNPPTILATL